MTCQFGRFFITQRPKTPPPPYDADLLCDHHVDGEVELRRDASIPLDVHNITHLMKASRNFSRQSLQIHTDLDTSLIRLYLSTMSNLSFRKVSFPHLVHGS